MAALLLISALLCGDSLDKGAAANANYNPDVALRYLARAMKEGPYKYADYVRLYEQVGLAHAYLEHKKEALAAFDRVLALDPGYALSCRLSPKATFLFEEARSQAQQREPMTLDLFLPRDLKITDPVPIAVRVVADPKKIIRRLTLFTRRGGEGSFQRHEHVAPPLGKYAELLLDPPAAASGPGVVQVFVTATDGGGNEVLKLGTSEWPREINLAYEPPPAWYQRWWVWVTAGVVVAGAVGGIVYWQTRPLPDTVSASGGVE